MNGCTVQCASAQQQPYPHRLRSVDVTARRSASRLRRRSRCLHCFAILLPFTVAPVVTALLPANGRRALPVSAACAAAAVLVCAALAALLGACVNLLAGAGLGPVVPHACQACMTTMQQHQQQQQGRLRTLLRVERVLMCEERDQHMLTETLEPAQRTLVGKSTA